MATDRISGLVVFLLGVAIFWQGRPLSLGTLRAPGPGLFPAVLAVLLVILSLFLIIPRETREWQGPFFSQSVGRALMVFLALVVYAFLLESLGFVITSLSLMIFLFITVAPQRRLIAGTLAVISIGLSYLLFEVLLKSNLPKGPFGF